MNQQNQLKDKKLGAGAYISLILILLFFSGILGKFDNWFQFFDFGVLSGKFGDIVETGANFQGSGGDGAKGGFLFALSLVPSVMFAIGAVSIAEQFGAMKAAEKLLSPILRPLLGIPGKAGLALITSFQSTDAGASMTKVLLDNGDITEDQASVFCAFQFSSDAIITNYFTTGAALFTLTKADGSTAVTVSMLIPFFIMIVLKFFGANLMRLYLLRKVNKKKAQAE